MIPALAPAPDSREAANRLHYFEPEEVLCGHALLQQYDGAGGGGPARQGGQGERTIVPAPLPPTFHLAQSQRNRLSISRLFSDEAVDRFLSHLVPSSMNVYFSSSKHPLQSVPEKERWYGARYGGQPLAPALMADLQSRLEGRGPCPDDGAEGSGAAATTMAPLHLPGRNWALPISTQLVASVPSSGDKRMVSAPSVSPSLVVDLPGLRAWHRTDINLGLPKAHVYIHLATPETYRSPYSWVCAKLYCRLLDDLLEADVYFAQLAATTYSLSCSETGLVLHIQV